ncbi:extended synaptotagmin-3 [Chanos chanos]|uniref:Extended synaptotagmin-3 n=1 Tax=Chanos chanos TaxID=29144 RepID=A0A6J2WAP9_CHACN|nr:extended synaptotagmin-3-like [Chanos chanos]
MSVVDSTGSVQAHSATTTDGDKFSPKDVNRMLLEFLMYMGKALLFFYPVYLTGSLGLSISWILLILVMFTIWKNNRRWKDRRIDTAINFLENESHVIDTELKALNMPAWIQFTEVEKADWINKVLRQAWPFFGMFMEKLLKETIQTSVRTSSPHLKTFTFTKVHFGQRPPRITGIRAYTHEVDKREVILDLNILYEGDVDIDADVKAGITAGVKGLQLQGMLRVILEPLIGQAPLVGGVTMFFIRRPTLQINWTGMTNLLDSPAFSHMSESTIVDIIASLMVLPNRMCFPLIDQVKVDQMRFPLPRGVVRVHLIEAQDLLAKDTYMMGLVKGKSDPYAIMRVGHIQFKSKTIKENLNPYWNEVREFVIHEAPGQELELEVYDEDTDKDDFLGRFNLDFGEVKKNKEMKEWFPLEEVSSGKLHLKLQWLSLQTDQTLLRETSDGCACAMLAVYLDNASNLPKDHHEFSHHEKHRKHSKETRLTKRAVNPSSYVEFSIDKQSQKSKVVYASKDPVYEECFTFFVHSVTNQVLNVQVKEPEKKEALGTFSLPLSRLLGAPDMTLDQRFQLERSGANSQIKMKVLLRVLKLEKPEPKPVVTPPSQTKPAASSQPQSSTQTPHQALEQAHSSPNSSSSGKSSRDPALTHPTNGFQSEYVPHRRGSVLLPDVNRSVPTTPSNMRRYDSHSILSDNSIASSRLDLTDGVPYPEAILNHQGSFGEIQLTVRYSTLRSRLMVLVNSCRNLFPCSENGSDVYVRMYLLPDQSWRHRMRTGVKRKTVNPVFNEKFEFSVSVEEAKTRKLDVSVKNNKMFHRRERREIGMVQIDLAEVDLLKGSTEWYELTIPGLKKTN